MKSILLLQAFASLNLMGLIWCIQRVHYPMFDRLDPGRFVDSIEWHGRRITWVVGPLMLLELACAAHLVLFPPWQSSVFLLGLALVVLLWLVTALVQVPIHGRLTNNYCAKDVALLVRSNWIRTFLWSARGLLALGMLM